MDEYMSEKAKKMKGQIEQFCVANKDKVGIYSIVVNTWINLQFIDFIEKKELPEFFVRMEL